MVAVAIELPPTLFWYQSITLPVGGTALKVTVPDAVLLAFVTVGTVGKA